MNNSQIGSMFGLDGEECPPGTVPIHRVRSVLSEEKVLKNHILSKNLPGLQVRYLIQSRLFIPINFILSLLVI